MHVPDGILSVPTAAVSGVLAAGGLGTALRLAGREVPPRRVPLMGLSAAFIFAAQMLNFPVLGGTSGHLVGGVLAAVLLGPSAAVVVMSAVLILQCLMFADGGLLALGANVLNMAIVGSVGGYLVYRMLYGLMPGRVGQLLAAGFAAWCSTVFAAVACAGELAASGIAWKGVFTAMAGIHMLIGIGEAIITMLILAAVRQARPGLIATEAADEPAGAWWGTAVLGLWLALGLAIFVAPQACGWPDGFEHVAEHMGFAQRATEPVVKSPLAEYQVGGIGSEGLSTAVAGVVGTVLAFGVAWAVARAIAQRQRGRAPGETAA